jgi:hypothetical protein
MAGEGLGERNMVTHRLLRSVQIRRALGGLPMVLFATMMSARAAIATDAVAVPPDGWTLRPGCDETCGLRHVSGEVYEPQPSVVASPGGTTYSVSHRVGADLDGTGPQPTTCFFINNPLLPGAPDDIVTFNAVAEPIRTDLFGTIPMVSECDTGQPNGRQLIVITTQSQPGTDLFPPGFFAPGGVPLKDACFSIGVGDSISPADPLTWAGTDTIESATLEFLTNGVTMAGPFDASSFFTAPWNGVVTITLPNGTGHGFNGVRLKLMTQKSISLPNDGCRGQILVTDGDTPYSTIGATTDGPEEPSTCNFSFYSDIGSDIWYRYAATCGGNLTVDLCNSDVDLCNGDFDTKLAVYDGCGQCPVSSPPLQCNDDSACGRRSRVTVPAVLGHCYTIRIGGYQGVQGTGTMRVSCDVPPPPSGACCENGICFATLTEADCGGQNGTWFQGGSCPSFACPVPPLPNDACTDCARVATDIPYHGRTQSATGTNISSCVDGDTLDVWNCWTADCTGRVTISTCGSSFDTSLAVYDACGGHELACDDDGCPLSPGLRSMVTLDVTEGTTYFIRVAGYNGAFGNYTLTVDECQNACCRADGLCALKTAAECVALGGTPLDPGSLCRGDENGNGVDDACEPCPQATIAGAVPPDGTVDAREPNSPTALLPREGIGSPGEPGTDRESILIVLNPRVPDAEGCFRPCETREDPLLGPNRIQSVTYNGAGVYELVLDRAITAGGVTTIEYLGGGSFIDYTAHPANVNVDSFSDASDVQEHVDCCLSALCAPAWGRYSCDIDRSGLVTAADALAVIDLLNGTQAWDVWLGSPLPTRGTCP